VQPLAGVNDDDQGQRRRADKVERLQSEAFGGIGERPVHGVHKHVVSHRRRDARHQKKWRDDQDVGDFLSEN
jgi:hypothetical protein